MIMTSISVLYKDYDYMGYSWRWNVDIGLLFQNRTKSYVDS